MTSHLDMVDADPHVRRGQLWFGLLGGGAAWTLHLLLAYLAAEFGCVSGMDRHRLLGISSVAWIILIGSVLLAAAAAAATWMAHRAHQRLQRHTGPRDLDGYGPFMASAGRSTSALFLLVILVQTVPVFFYLQRC
jgi:hypothetical protein